MYCRSLPLFNLSVFPSKASAKIQPFSKLANFFLLRNGFLMLSHCGTAIKKLNFFFIGAVLRPQTGWQKTFFCKNWGLMMQKLQICVYIASVQHFNPILRGILSDDINRGEVSSFRFSFADIALSRDRKRAFSPLDLRNVQVSGCKVQWTAQSWFVHWILLFQFSFFNFQFSI